LTLSLRFNSGHVNFITPAGAKLTRETDPLSLKTWQTAPNSAALVHFHNFRNSIAIHPED